VLLHTPDPDLIRHAVAPPAVAPADELPARGQLPWWDIRYDPAVDISDPDAVGPATLDVWTRFPGAPDDLTTSQALLAYASDGFLIGTAIGSIPEAIPATLVGAGLMKGSFKDAAGYMAMAVVALGVIWIACNHMLRTLRGSRSGSALMAEATSLKGMSE
jgi:hypothetical protein